VSELYVYQNSRRNNKKNWEEMFEKGFWIKLFWPRLVLF